VTWREPHAAARAAGHQREPHWQGLSCWQPHWQAVAAGAASWQPQAQLAPGQKVQAQRVVSVVMADLLGVVKVGDGGPGVACGAHSGHHRRGGIERKG
jgi:hypothetical protein